MRVVARVLRGQDHLNVRPDKNQQTKKNSPRVHCVTPRQLAATSGAGLAVATVGATTRRDIGVIRVLLAPAVGSEQRTAKCRLLSVVFDVCTRSSGNLIEITLGIPTSPLDCPGLVVPIFLFTGSGHLSYIHTLKITWGSRAFLLFMLGSGVYRASSGDECSGFRDGDDDHRSFREPCCRPPSPCRAASSSSDTRGTYASVLRYLEQALHDGARGKHEFATESSRRASLGRG